MNVDPNVIATATGASGVLNLPVGRDHKLSFTSAGAFVLTLQDQSGDGTTWRDTYAGTNKVTIDSASTTSSLSYIVPGGTYRMNVTTYNNPITMWAQPV